MKTILCALCLIKTGNILMKILRLSFRLFQTLQCYKISFYKVMILLSWNLLAYSKTTWTYSWSQTFVFYISNWCYTCSRIFFFLEKNQTNGALSWTNLNRKRGKQFCSDLQQWLHYLEIWIYTNCYVHVHCYID